MSAPVECKNASAISSRVSGLRTRIGLLVLMLSGRFSHCSTLKTVYARIIGTRRMEELPSASLSRTCSCLTKNTAVPRSPLRTLPPNSRACLNVRKRGVRYPAAWAIHNRTTLHPEYGRLLTALHGVFAPGLADHGLTQGAAPSSNSATMRADTSA